MRIEQKRFNGININDYETVLNNLLSTHIPYFQNKGIHINEQELSKTTGMQWIIRGKGFGQQ